MTLRAVANVSLPVLFLLAGCDTPQTHVKKEPEKPAEPLTGRAAFWKVYPSARAWALDAKPLTMESYHLSQIKAGDGQAGAWQVTFVSEALRKQRAWTWSAIEILPSIHKGVWPGAQEDWSGPSGPNATFEVAALMIDSDAAFDTAMKQKDAARMAAKAPDKTIKYLLEKTRRYPDLAWRIIFGEGVGSSDSVSVDASTGAYLR